MPLIPVICTWFSKPNPKILGHLAQCCIVSNPLSVWESLAEGNLVASDRITLLNDCGLHRHLRTFFTKQKLFFFKVQNEVKIGQFLTSYDPFKEVCCFLFLLLIKLILNFKNVKKALSKLFLKPLINVVVQ
jgi:hypothetical protein